MQLTQHFRNIDNLIERETRVTLSVFFSTDFGMKEVVFDFVNIPEEPREITVHFRKNPGMYEGEHLYVETIMDAFLCTREKMLPVTPLLDSVAILTGPISPSLYKEVRNAWASTFALNDVSNNSFLTVPEEIEQYRAKLVGDGLIALLSRGGDSVERWNDIPHTLFALCKVDLSNLTFAKSNISNVRLWRINAQNTHFDGIEMMNGFIKHCNMDKATFRLSEMSRAEFSHVSLNAADFSGSKLIDATFVDSQLRRANFTDAKLSGCGFNNVDLCGANFTDADMSAVYFNRVKVDDKTKFPASLTDFGALIWKGKGNNPYIDKALFDAALSVATTDDFVRFLEHTIDSSRLTKALKMLKSDRFQLYSEHCDYDVAGILRSQTDADLVYACFLDEKGSYSCSTQNLNSCGGLRGSLCKHVLVLIIGLVNAGKLKPSNVAKWCAASTACRPKKSDALVTELFLKFKSAATGEIDWRPTETIPEDYYAF